MVGTLANQYANYYCDMQQQDMDSRRAQAKTLPKDGREEGKAQGQDTRCLYLILAFLSAILGEGFGLGSPRVDKTKKVQVYFLNDKSSRKRCKSIDGAASFSQCTTFAMVFMLETCTNLSAFGWIIRICWLDKCKLCLLLGL